MRIKQIMFAVLLASLAALSGCKDPLSGMAKAEQELPARIIQQMNAKDMPKGSPILVRVFKEENLLEVWKQKRNGDYGLIATYEICKWSGKLGPKFMEGDRQAPEGFYTVKPSQMNPHSSYYLAFNIGFPNAYDRVNGRTGRHLMVHGACSSSGCYSMTDKSIAQIYAFGRDSFRGGQREFQVQAFPFKMTATNMARYKDDPNYQFWTMLKQGYDYFEVNKRPARVDVCERKYVFNRVAANAPALDPNGPCPPEPAVTSAFTTYQKNYQSAFSAALGGVFSKKPLPSIVSLEEAKLVADWTRRRASGERVSREPPSLTPESAEISNAPDIE